MSFTDGKLELKNEPSLSCTPSADHPRGWKKLLNRYLTCFVNRRLGFS